jgi:hypothetical protein
MSFENERRMHARYPLRLAIRLRRGAEELDAEIVNASVGGCLLLLAFPLEPGEVVEVTIPELRIPRARLRVVRCMPASPGFSVATSFEAPAVTDSALERLSSHEPRPSLRLLRN